MNAWKIRRTPGLFTTMLCVILLGCASELVTPVIGYTPPLGEKAAETAISMIGMPYKFRGESPEGFDCSGLVRYSYRTAGLEVPHGTKALKVVTIPVSLQDISIGDLLFFNERGKKNSHVGIFLGGDIFVHATSSGGKVRPDFLSDPYWEKSFSEARRFLFEKQEEGE